MGNKDALQFLVDYENVGESGLDGMTYLQDTDTLAVFYSTTCDKISRKTIDVIMRSGCSFETFYLKKTGKNALDFYIVSRIGELLGAGFEGKLIVVSKDKGYSAMRDYWASRGIPSQRILLKHSLREGIIASNEASARRNLAVKESAQVSIRAEYAKYQEREHLRKQMEDIFCGTEYEKLLANICDLAESGRQPKKLYLGSLQRFGRTDGTAIYRLMKQAAEIPASD